MDFDPATFAYKSTYVERLYFLLKHADFRALIEPLPRQPHHEGLQVFVREGHATTMPRCNSDEASFVEPSSTEPKTKAIMQEHFHAIGAFVHEEIRMMSSSFAEHIDHPRERRVDTGAHIQRLNRKPGSIDADHFMSSLSKSAHSRAADAGHSILTH